LKILFSFFTKTSYLNEEVNCTEPSPSVSIPCFSSFFHHLSHWSKMLTLTVIGRLVNVNGTANIIHQCRKTTALRCHRCLINTCVEKNEQHINIGYNFYHQICVSKSKYWYSNNCLHVLNCAVPL
jgi:hypothetical protein